VGKARAEVRAFLPVDTGAAQSADAKVAAVAALAAAAPTPEYNDDDDEEEEELGAEFQSPFVKSAGATYDTLTRARQEAERLKQHFIGAEHVFLALLLDATGPIAGACAALGLDAEKVRAEIERLERPSPVEAAYGQLLFSPLLKRSFEYAGQRAQALHAERMGPEHLLLGLLEEEDGMPARVVLNLGVRPEDLRKKTLEQLGKGGA
jgi:hypothetical protein